MNAVCQYENDGYVICGGTGCRISEGDGKRCGLQSGFMAVCHACRQSIASEISCGDDALFFTDGVVVLSGIF